ncbi:MULTISPECIES: poly-beta-1,6-N-acetyl-D-glucosamine N-deacetylase PgaB [Gulbenkiania]|uniref:Poly-beta-1,6-N-acetyl-D-glucosamine N-deacetylase PgaB n=2 Tax=Gulbenkiania TaxID=397456 RepID=A0A0K6GW03_9NEIS|nr:MULTISPECIES: poly-beta-1,6-N-acetyl-D-glucosamine N-deacetylase PgaB [Gulbenkiania]TCW30775.1 biofilm PGA synthesis lipoprotein PgaB [Gulbenkiania mobilis]CUA82789.1 poly-beta-1,6-N-acetyl-D-glucosamine N-deacetylase PgaB [Gulbenkiania indica]
MTKRLRSLLLAIALQFVAACALAAPAKLTILSYHEIAEKNQALVPDYAVSPTNFVRQMDWLKNNGYHFVGLGDVIADRQGKKPLPPKAVLLTFDDGYRSVYDHAYPTLKLFHAPAVIALVGKWLEPESGTVSFDGKAVPRSDLLSWAQIKEMTESGLVEVASHSHSMHEGIRANPQGNMEPAATTRRYLTDQKHYENEAVYRQRVLDDLRHNNEVLYRHTGQRPRAIAWPYGSYNTTTVAAAQQLGMPVGFTLDDGPNDSHTPLTGLRRVLIESGYTLWDLRNELEIRDAGLTDNDRPAKIMHVDLDYIYDPDPAQQERNLGHLLDRIVAMGVNTVYLQAYADPDGNGAADAVYFPNRHLPMRADLFNRVAWQIRTRTPVKRLYAWMPMLAFELPAKDPAAGDKVVTQPNKANHVSMGYPRLSPFSPRARQAIREIYQDLARAAPFEGLLFHDDVTLSDYEDASPWALATYKAWGLPQDLQAIRASDSLLGRWTILKINALDNFARELADVVRQDHPGLKTARNLYASVALNPRSEVWYSQALENSLNNYDFTAIMAMPYMENAQDPKAFYREIFERVSEYPKGLSKTVFELQAIDWRNNEPVPSKEMADTIKMLYGWGVKHVGYYPDALHRDHPDPAVLKPVFASKPNAPQLP